MRAVRSSGRLAVVALLLCVAGASAMALGARNDHRGGQAAFSIRGKVAHLAWPGSRRRLDPLVSNPNPYPLRVHRLHLRGRVDRAHRSLGCAMRMDFRVRQVPRAAAFTVPARTTLTLRALGVHRRPVLRFRNDPVRNQDACKGATIHLRYRGWATLLRADPEPGS